MKNPIKYVITIRKQDNTIETYVKASKWNSDQVRSFVIRSYPIKEGAKSIKHVFIIETLDGEIPENIFQNVELTKQEKAYNELSPEDKKHHDDYVTCRQYDNLHYY